MRLLALLAAALCCLALAAQAQAQQAGSSAATIRLPRQQCPPPGFDALKEFNVTEYISAPWFVQYQLPLPYQPKSQLYCVRAVYERLNASTLKVINTARDGSVAGPKVGTSQGSGLTLTAVIRDQRQPSKLTVGFRLARGQLAPGPYWVVAAGANPGSRPGSYDWAIIAGGEPNIKGPDGLCKMRDNTTNGSGLWLFSRKPSDPESTTLMLSKLKELGIDAAGLEKVTHDGCTYDPVAAVART